MLSREHITEIYHTLSPNSWATFVRNVRLGYVLVTDQPFPPHPDPLQLFHRLRLRDGTIVEVPHYAGKDDDEEPEPVRIITSKG